MTAPTTNRTSQQGADLIGHFRGMSQLHLVRRTTEYDVPHPECGAFAA